MLVNRWREKRYQQIQILLWILNEYSNNFYIQVKIAEEAQ